MKLKRLIYLVIACCMSLCCLLAFGGCKDNNEDEDNRYLDRVYVIVKEEYTEAFLSQSFTIEDFDWANIESIRYQPWFESVTTNGEILVFLKKHGVREIESAAKHFRKLEFVKDTDFERNPHGSVFV